jgi:hypothetical protein
MVVLTLPMNAKVVLIMAEEVLFFFFFLRAAWSIAKGRNFQSRGGTSFCQIDPTQGGPKWDRCARRLPVGEHFLDNDAMFCPPSGCPILRLCLTQIEGSVGWA